MVRDYLSMIKFSHTIFALPFALVGFFLGVLNTNGPIPWTTLGLVVLAMVFARSAAMAFNRFIDRDIDKANPRTATREIAAGTIKPSNALFFIILNSVLFVAITFFINRLCFVLSPVALVVILGYSYTKRVTSLSHYVLGLGLSLSPVGAYLAVTGHFDLIPILLGGVVFSWVAGFDIIYALQDEEFDKNFQLRSIPVILGKKNALVLSTITHIFTGTLLYIVIRLTHLAYPEQYYLMWIGAVIFLGLLAYQHFLVKPKDLSKVNMAFFTTNGIASIVFGTFFILDFFF